MSIRIRLSICFLVFFVMASTLSAQTARNLALGKSARQSSVLNGADANRAVDGNKNQNWNGQSMTHTQNDYKAWWEVDLGGVYEISKVTVYNRTDNDQQRLDGYYVMVSADPFPSGPAAEAGSGVLRYYRAKAGQIDELSTIVSGRYVRIQLKGQNFLHIAEVEVYSKGSAPGPIQTVAPPSSGQAQTLLYEGFENLSVPRGIPNGWIVKDTRDPSNAQAWEIYAEAGKSKEGKQYARTAFPKDSWLITPELKLPSGTGSLVFWARAEDSSTPETLNIYISSGETDPQAFGQIGQASKIPTTYTRYEFPLSPWAGKALRIGFQAINSQPHYILDLDEVSVVFGGSGTTASQPAPLTQQPVPQKAPVQTVQPSSGKYEYSAIQGTAEYRDQVRTVVRGPDKFIAVGDQGMVYVSDTNGKNWSKTPQKIGAYHNKSIVWANGFYLVVQTSGNVFASPDGINWTETAKLNADMWSLVWTGSQFVAGCSAGYGFTSPDGKNWTKFDSKYNETTIFDLAYGNGQIVAAGKGGNVLLSRDGRTWSLVASGTSENLLSVAYGKPGYVMGSSGNQSAVILFSPDGRTWSTVYTGYKGLFLRTAYWDGDRFLVGGDSGLILESFDGKTWNKVNTGSMMGISGFASGNGTTIAVQLYGGFLSSPSPVFTNPPPVMSPPAGLFEVKTSAPAQAIPGSLAAGGSGVFPANFDMVGLWAEPGLRMPFKKDGRIEGNNKGAWKMSGNYIEITFDGSNWETYLFWDMDRIIPKYRWEMHEGKTTPEMGTFMTRLADTPENRAVR